MKIYNLYGKNCQHGYRTDNTIKYIVIHYTGNVKDTAKGNASFFHNSGRNGVGAHFFVDSDGIIYQSIPINQVGWSVGGKYTLDNGAGKYYEKCTNTNSVSIEMCNITSQATYKQMVSMRWLVKRIQKKYKYADKIIRHWDVNGKSCPSPMIGDNNSRWNELLHFINYGYLKKAKVTKSAKVRKSPKVVANNIVGSRKKGDTIRVRAVVGKWVMLASETDNGSHKWIAKSKTNL